MSPTKALSSKVIIVVETVAIVILAVIVVIYAQVLIQQYAFQNQGAADGQDDVTPEEVGATSYSVEERMQVLEELRAVEGGEVTSEDRQAALDTLVSGPAVVEPTPAEMQERMRVLESLR